MKSILWEFVICDGVNNDERKQQQKRGAKLKFFLSLARERENVKTTDGGTKKLWYIFFLHIKPTKGLGENIYDLKYSLASLIKIVDEDGKKQTNRQKQTKRSSGGIK